jgi:hypothetical protein
MRRAWTWINRVSTQCRLGLPFRFADLRRKPNTTVPVCLPLDKLDVSKKYFRILAASRVSDILSDVFAVRALKSFACLMRSPGSARSSSWPTLGVNSAHMIEVLGDCMLQHGAGARSVR